jgi:hypothetical protein
MSCSISCMAHPGSQYIQPNSFLHCPGPGEQRSRVQMRGFSAGIHRGCRHPRGAVGLLAGQTQPIVCPCSGPALRHVHISLLAHHLVSNDSRSHKSLNSMLPTQVCMAIATGHPLQVICMGGPMHICTCQQSARSAKELWCPCWEHAHGSSPVQVISYVWTRSERWIVAKHAQDVAAITNGSHRLQRGVHHAAHGLSMRSGHVSLSPTQTAAILQDVKIGSRKGASMTGTSCLLL